MLYQAQSTMATEPWVAIFPGLFIFGTVFSVFIIGDRVGDDGVPA
jgi:ABC-type dipeptide/oligopeptide/nickel transport system permease subunit